MGGIRHACFRDSCTNCCRSLHGLLSLPHLESTAKFVLILLDPRGVARAIWALTRIGEEDEVLHEEVANALLRRASEVMKDGTAEYVATAMWSLSQIAVQLDAALMRKVVCPCPCPQVFHSAR